MNCSIIIPAHNEEKLIGHCLESIRQATLHGQHTTEVIVVANRCTDRTIQIAQEFGAVIVVNEDKNLSKIRNNGAKCARSEILITIDADSRMSPNTLTVIEQKLASGKYIGGGVKICGERYSAGILVTLLLLHAVLLVTRLCGGLYWCYRKDFEAIGGFNENLLVAEDLDFARRLRTHGREKGLRLHRITEARITTSCRKFDTFGDWFVLRMLLHPRIIYRTITGNNNSLANRFFYDYNP